MWHLDILSNDELRTLADLGAEPVVTITVPTTSVTAQIEGSRIAFKNLLTGLESHGIARELIDGLEALVDDEDFWANQSNGLAVVAFGDRVLTYRLPQTVPASLQIGDRPNLTPLIEAGSATLSAHVLVLSEGCARVIDMAAGMPPVEVKVADMPADAASFAGKSSINDRSLSGRLVGSEGKRVHITSYARAVDDAMRAWVHADPRPVILVATQPIAGIYRSVSGLSQLAAEGLAASADQASATEIAEMVAPVLDQVRRDRADELASLVADRLGGGRVLADAADIVHAASMAKVSHLLIRSGFAMTGSVDASGSLDLTSGQDLICEVAARVLLTGGVVQVLDADHMPAGADWLVVTRHV